ncbi:hypothetical protein CROQUDRAFT_325180 [Cronartium quercuum f. sp. fusiforme G11]|uniref:Uncharacterized protein n=1 Tax=Cronartium quercuum f. sp. fusiforme G11 TaxID=708437 RepID=A0A9P6T6E6_9BASI|nr:hypothetical protein CROQUDRAFT_325180 [Cronartium quercuum f. sp. fusiforme G11]
MGRVINGEVEVNGWEGSGEGESGLMSQKGSSSGRISKKREGEEITRRQNSLQKVWDGSAHGPSPNNSQGADDEFFENYSITLISPGYFTCDCLVPVHGTLTQSSGLTVLEVLGPELC